jgi:hypothetical protein
VGFSNPAIAMPIPPSKSAILSANVLSIAKIVEVKENPCCWAPQAILINYFEVIKFDRRIRQSVLSKIEHLGDFRCDTIV